MSWISRNIAYVIRHFPPARYSATRLSGRQDDVGAHLTILLAGPSYFTTHLAQLTFGDSYEETPLGRVCSWNLGRLARDVGADVLFAAGIPRYLFNRFGGDRALYFFAWLHGKAELAPLLKRFETSRQIKRYVKMFRKHDIEYDVTTDPARIEDFFYNMYVPYTKQRYQSTAHVYSFEPMREVMDCLELTLARQGDTYIAGNVLHYDSRGAVHRLHTGVKDGDPAYLKTGAGAALYYNDALYLSRKGFETLHYGMSRTFLRDGVLQFKKAFGMRLLDSFRTGGSLIIPMNDSPQTKAFFEKTPVICVNNDKLAGAVFVPPDAVQSIRHLKQAYKQYYYEGMDRLRILTSGNPADHPPVPDELKSTLTIEPAAGFFPPTNGRSG